MSRFRRSSLETNAPVVFARCRGFGGGVFSLGRCRASSVGGAEVQRSITDPTSDASSRASWIVLRTVPTPLRLPAGLSGRGGKVLWMTAKAWMVVWSAGGL